MMAISIQDLWDPIHTASKAEEKSLITSRSLIMLTLAIPTCKSSKWLTKLFQFSHLKILNWLEKLQESQERLLTSVIELSQSVLQQKRLTKLFMTLLLSRVDIPLLSTIMAFLEAAVHQSMRLFATVFLIPDLCRKAILSTSMWLYISMASIPT